MYTITKEVKFDAAHRLMNYKGLCNNIHGHTYKVLITIASEDYDIGSNFELNQSGMLLDFGIFKERINKIISDFDHAIILNCKDTSIIKFVKENGLRLFEMNGEPTAENMANYFFRRFEEFFSELKEVTVYETDTAFATYSNGDQKEGVSR